MCLLPFCFVTNWTMRKNMKHKKTSRFTFMRHLQELTDVVEAKITDSLPDVFALVFDGLTEGDTHQVAILATYPSEDFKWSYEKVVLGCAPLREEELLNAQVHCEDISFELSIFSRALTNVCTLIGDSCTSNVYIGNLVQEMFPNCFFIGCPSHRIHWAVEDLLQPYKPVIDKVNGLMKKL